MNLKEAPETFKTESIEMLKKIDLEKFAKVEFSDEILDKLENLNLNEDIDINDLPDDIREDFKKSLKDGRISTWITTYEPFWLKKNFVLKDNDYPKIESLTKMKLSEDLIYNLIDLM